MTSRLKRRITLLWGRFADRMASPPLAYIFRLLPQYFVKLTTAVLFLVCAGSLASMIAVLAGKFTDEGFVNQNPDMIWWAPASLLTITITSGISVYVGSYLLKDVSQSIVTIVRQKMFDRMLLWTPDVYKKQTTGDVNATFINIVANALSASANIITILVRDTLNILCLVTVLFYHNWRLTLLTFVIAPLMIWITKFIRKKVKALMAKIQSYLVDMSDHLQETHANYKAIKMFDSYDSECARFKNFNDEFKRKHIRMSLIAALGAPLAQMAMMVGVSVVIVAALWQTKEGQLTVGEFVTFLSALMLMGLPLRHLASLSGNIASFEYAAKVIYDFMHTPTENLSKGVTKETALTGSIQLNHVSFRYGKGDYAVKDISFSVKPRETVALVGASGSGKSTIVNLIAGFMPLTEGTIEYDGISHRDISLQYLRSNLSIVNQEMMLFDDTLTNNVAYGKKDATTEEIEGAMRAAYLTDVIEKSVDGMDLRIGTAGNLLSGGQKQRLAIARAYIKQAPILLLDEATSALDNTSEHFVMESLKTLMKTCTTVVVAHRLSTILGADRIIVMDHGEIIEEGTHEELLERNGAYAKLYRLQFSGDV